MRLLLSGVPYVLVLVWSDGRGVRFGNIPGFCLPLAPGGSAKTPGLTLSGAGHISGHRGPNVPRGETGSLSCWRP